MTKGEHKQSNIQIKCGRKVEERGEIKVKNQLK